MSRPVTPSVLARAALLALAAVAVALGAQQLRATNLVRDGDRALGGPGHAPPTAPAGRAADENYRRAGRANPDPDPEIRQAALLVATGRMEEAVVLLRGVVGANPGQVDAWSLLARAARHIDSRAAAQARRRLAQFLPPRSG